MEPMRWTWKVLDLDDGLVERLGRKFETDLYRAVLELEPDNVQVLIDLGNLYSQLGCLRDGLAVDKRLVEIRPMEPTFHYNLACSHSLLGEIEEALAAIERAVELGYRNLDYLQKDADLANVRADARFHRLLGRLHPASESDSRGLPEPTRD